MLAPVWLRLYFLIYVTTVICMTQISTMVLCFDMCLKVTDLCWKRSPCFVYCWLSLCNTFFPNSLDDKKSYQFI